MDARLTPRQAEVVRYYEAQVGVPEIAELMGIRPQTVRVLAVQARKAGAVFPRAVSPGARRKIDWFVYARHARDGEAPCQIADRYGVNRNTVSRALAILRESGAKVPPVPARVRVKGRWVKRDQHSIEIIGKINGSQPATRCSSDAEGCTASGDNAGMTPTPATVALADGPQALAGRFPLSGREGRPERGNGEASDLAAPNAQHLNCTPHAHDRSMSHGQ